MKLSEWSKQQGITYRTAWQWFKDGKLPVKAMKTPTGTILVEQELVQKIQGVTLYCRVSSSDQKSDLDRQISRLAQYAQAQGLPIVGIITEIGSGLNGRRSKLSRLLRDERARLILVEHRDRLMRFGFEYVASTLAAQGRRVIVADESEIDESELKDDLVQDMIEVLTSFCARLYGRRSAKNKAQKALRVLQGEIQ